MSLTVRLDSARHALADLRAIVRASDDDMNAVSGSIYLADGTRLDVGLATASDGGKLLGVYEARRVFHSGAVRVYPLS